MTGRKEHDFLAKNREWEAALKSTHKDLGCVDLPSQWAHVGPSGNRGEGPLMQNCVSLEEELPRHCLSCSEMNDFLSYG